MLERAETNEEAALDHVNLNYTKEDEVGGPAGSGSSLGVLPVNNLYDSPHHKVHNELEDIEDEVELDGSVGFSNNTAASRRRLRMVLDVEDDD